MLFQVIVVRCIVTVIMVKAAVFVFGPFIEISLQLAKPFQGRFILDLHQHLINWGN